MIEHAIAQAAEAGARKALAAHVPKLALSVNEVAKATGAGVTTVRRWVTDGHLPRVPYTDRVLIPVAAVEAFVLSGGEAAPWWWGGLDDHRADRARQAAATSTADPGDTGSAA